MPVVLLQVDGNVVELLTHTALYDAAAAAVTVGGGAVMVAEPPALTPRQPPRNPFPSTLIVPEKVIDNASMATTPPVAPFHAGAVTVPVKVAVWYCGTRITWKVRCPRIAVAEALA